MQITYTTSNVKQMNIELIRTVIKTNPCTTKAGITAITGLSHATCNNLLNELVETGEVLELDKENNSGGRPSQRYQYNSDFFNVLSLYIDNDSKKTVIRYVIFNLMGAILEEDAIPKDYLDHQTIEGIIAYILKKNTNVKAIGIGIPGVVLNQRVIDTCDVESLNKCPLAKHIECRFGISTLLENDMNATAIGFYSQQDYHEDTSIAVMTFIKDNFPGSGIIVNGHILRGHTEFAGEIRYLPYDQSVQQLEEMLGKSSTTLPLVVKSVCSMIAILNPETIILTGSLINENMMEEIKKSCAALIPKDHMPHIYLKESIHNFYLNGLFSMSLKALTFPVVEKQ